MWPGTAGVSWCVNLYVGQEVRPARGNKKNLIRFCPVGARRGACPLKKLRLDYEVGVSPEGEPNMIVFLASVGVKDNRRIPVGFRVTDSFNLLLRSEKPLTTRPGTKTPICCYGNTSLEAPICLAILKRSSVLRRLPEPTAVIGSLKSAHATHSGITNERNN
jgi:hypothetical protein